MTDDFEARARELCRLWCVDFKHWVTGPLEELNVTRIAQALREAHAQGRRDEHGKWAKAWRAFRPCRKANCPDDCPDCRRCERAIDRLYELARALPIEEPEGKPTCKRCGKPRREFQVYCGAACSAQRNEEPEGGEGSPAQHHEKGDD